MIFRKLSIFELVILILSLNCIQKRLLVRDFHGKEEVLFSLIESDHLKNLWRPNIENKR